MSPVIPYDPLNNDSEVKLAPFDLRDDVIQSQSKDTGDIYPAGWKLATIVVGLCLACILSALVTPHELQAPYVLIDANTAEPVQDNTILTTAIPLITKEFNSLDDVGWYASAFLLTTCSVSLVYGKLYTYYPIKWIYLAALGLFDVQGVVAVQAALPPHDVPSGTLILMFTQTMGGAVFVSAAQSLFHNKLLEGITQNVPDVDAKKVIDAGATMLKDTVSAKALPGVLEAYNSAITCCFYIGVAFAGLAIFGAFPMQWISVKTKA